MRRELKFDWNQYVERVVKWVRGKGEEEMRFSNGNLSKYSTSNRCSKLSLEFHPSHSVLTTFDVCRRTRLNLLSSRRFLCNGSGSMKINFPPSSPKNVFGVHITNYTKLRSEWVGGGIIWAGTASVSEPNMLFGCELWFVLCTGEQTIKCESGPPFSRFLTKLLLVIDTSWRRSEGEMNRKSFTEQFARHQEQRSIKDET